MNDLKDTWSKLKPTSRNLIILVITAVVILIVLLLIRRLVMANKRKNQTSSSSSSSSPVFEHMGGVQRPGSLMVQTGKPESQVPAARQVQFQQGSQIHQEQVVNSDKLVGSAGVAPGSCGGDCGEEQQSHVQIPNPAFQPAQARNQEADSAHRYHTQMQRERFHKMVQTQASNSQKSSQHETAEKKTDEEDAQIDEVVVSHRSNLTANRARVAASTLNRSAIPAPRQEQIFDLHEGVDREEVKANRKVRFAGKNDE